MNKRQFKKVHCVVTYEGIQVRSLHPVPVRERKQLRALFLAYAQAHFEKAVYDWMSKKENQMKVINEMLDRGDFPGWSKAS